MENPMSWGDLEKTIDKAIDEWHEGQLAGRVGGSQVMCIATALREAGFIKQSLQHEHDGMCELCGKSMEGMPFRYHMSCPSD